MTDASSSTTTGPAPGAVPRVPALVVTGATKSFAGVQVLHGVDLEIPAGAVRSIVGHNGSGKSTLVKLLSGFHPLEKGTGVSVDGRPVHLAGAGAGKGHGSAAAHAAGLRFVHQDLGLVHRLSATDNLAFGLGFPTTRLGTISWARARRRADEILHDLGYNLDVTVPVGMLTPGGRTGIALARALHDSDSSARVVVLDEPTAAMSKAEFEHLAEVVADLTSRGLAVVYISHHLDEVLELGGSVSVLRDGRLVTTEPVAELTGARLVDLMVGRTLVPASPEGRAARTEPAGPIVLEVTGLECGRIAGLDLQVREGEVLGVTGLDGSGREEVAGALSGLLPRRGTVRVGTTTVRPGSPRAVVDAGMGCLLADRASSGVLPRMSAGWNLTVTGVSRYRRRGLLSSRAERADAESWMEWLGVVPARQELPVATLSGGNQQKVLLGRWLRSSPRVMVLAEPTQGVDVAAQHDIHQRIRDAAAAGAAVLVCSSDATELAVLCHRVLVMRQGLVVAELVGDAITVERMDSTSLWQEGAA